MRSLKFKGVYQVALAVALSAGLFAAGCSDDDDATEPPETFAAPSNLIFQNGDGEVLLRWDPSADESFDEFVGYNVYQSNASMVDLSGSELADLLVNVSGVISQSTLTIRGLTNGDLEYFAVRSVHENGNLSSGGAQVRTSSVNGGLDIERVISISEFADGAENSAVDLSEGISYPFEFANKSNVDFYLGTEPVDGDDDASRTLMIKSPDAVDSPNDWSDRLALFKVLDDPNASTTSSAGFLTGGVVLGTTTEEIEDMVIAVRLPADENGEFHYGKIEILQVSNLDTPGMREIALLWTYQPAAGELIF